MTRAPLPRVFWWLWVGTLVNKLGAFVFPFLVLYLTTDRQLSTAVAGGVLFCLGLGAVVSQPLGGWLADRVGRVRTLSVSLVAAGISLAALGTARELPALVAAALLTGLFADMYRPASAALVSDVVPESLRTYAFGLLFWAVNLGFALAAILAGRLAPVGYGWLFAVDATSCIAYGVIVFAAIRRDPPRPPVRHDDRGYGRVLRDRLLLLVMALTVIHATAYIQTYIAMPLSATGDGLTTADVGLILATNGLVIVVLQPLVSRGLASFDRGRVVATANVVMGLGFALTSLASTLSQYVATTIVWTLGEVMMAGFLAAIVADLAPPEARGRYQGMLGVSFALAGLAAPLVGTVVYDWVGPTALWLGAGVASVFVAAGFLLLDPPLRSRAAAGTAGSVPV